MSSGKRHNSDIPLRLFVGSLIISYSHPNPIASIHGTYIYPHLLHKNQTFMEPLGNDEMRSTPPLHTTINQEAETIKSSRRYSLNKLTPWNLTNLRFFKVWNLPLQVRSHFLFKFYVVDFGFCTFWKSSCELNLPC